MLAYANKIFSVQCLCSSFAHLWGTKHVRGREHYYASSTSHCFQKLGALTRGSDIPANFNTAVYRQGRRWAGRLCFAPVEDLRAELKNADSWMENPWKSMSKWENMIKTNLMKRYEKCMTVAVMGIWNNQLPFPFLRALLCHSLFWFAPNSSSITNAIAWCITIMMMIIIMMHQVLTMVHKYKRMPKLLQP